MRLTLKEQLKVAKANLRKMLAKRDKWVKDHPGQVCTSALLRLECSIDCRSGSVGHHQNLFPFIFCQLIHTF